MSNMGALRQPEDLSSGEAGRAGDRTLLISDSNLADEKGALKFVEAAYQNIKRQKVSLERQWAESLDMYAGRHYTLPAGTTERFAALHFPTDRVRYSANLLSTYVQTRRSKMLRSNPYMHVSPATNEPEDHEIAKVSTRILKFLWQELGIQGNVLPRAIEWLLVCGMVGLKSYYDPNSGPALHLSDDELTGEAAVNADKIGRSADGGVRVFLGEAKIEPVSPFWLYPDSHAETWEDCAFILDVRRRSLDWIRENFPERGRLVVDEHREQRDHYESRDRYFHSLAAGGVSIERGNVPSAYVKELWVKPCRKYPRGVHLISTSSVLLQAAQPLPRWCDGELPFSFVLDKPLPGSLWPQAVYDDLKDIQKVFNRAVSQIVEVSNRTANPVKLVPAGCRVNAHQFTNEPGLILQYVPVQGLKPEYMETPSLPDYCKTLPDVLMSHFMTVSGHNEPTLTGQAPTNVRTSSGLAQLIKEDDSRLSVQIKSLEHGLSRGVKKALKVVAFEYDEPRMGRIVGDFDDVEVFSFTGKNMLGKEKDTPGADYFDVEIRVDSGHRSKSSQQEFLLNAAQMGLVRVDNEEERLWLLRTLDIGTPDDDMFGDLRLAEAQARIENRWMAQMDDQEWQEGQQYIGPHEWDITQAHVEAHQSYMRKPDFLELFREHPERVQRFMEHLNAHRIKEQEEFEEEAARAQMQGGMQQGPPPPAQPGSMSMPGLAEGPNPMQDPGVDPRQAPFLQ